MKTSSSYQRRIYATWSPFWTFTAGLCTGLGICTALLWLVVIP